jgi:aspartate dehydrogenase
MAAALRVAVAGLGSIGLKVALALDRGVPGLALAAVAVREPASARARLARLRGAPAVVPLARLAERADVVVECLPPAVFLEAARPVLERGRTLVPASAGALLEHDEECRAIAARTGARIVVPSGAIVGVDGLRAAAAAGLEEVSMVTRKPPASFGAEVQVDGRVLRTSEIEAPVRLYAGSAREAIRRLPVNVNVAAAVSLAGLGADRTRVEVWADPGVERNRHQLRVRSAVGEFTAAVDNLPDPENPKTSAVTAYSIIGALRRMVEPVAVGS